MKITQVRIKNFLSFGEKDVAVGLSEFNVIVGPNASGKTNFLRVLTYVGNSLKRGWYGPDLEYYHVGNSSHSFEIEVGITLDEGEIDALIDCLICIPFSQSIQPKDGESQPLDQRVAFEIAARLPKQVLVEFFRNVSLVVRGIGKETDAPDKFIKLTAAGKTLYLDRSYLLRNSMERKPSFRSEYLGRLLIDAAITLNSELATYLASGEMPSDKTAQSLSRFDFEKVFDAVISYFDSGSIGAISFGYIEIEGLERQGLLPNVRRLREFLRERGYSERGIDFFNILDAIYSSSIIRLSELRSRPDPYTILPSNLTTFAHGLAEISGRELSVILFYLLTSTDGRDRKRYLEIKKEFEKLTGMSFDLTFRIRGKASPDIGTSENSGEVPIIVSIPRYGDNREPSVKLGSDTYSHEVSIVIKDRGEWIPLSFSAAGIFELLVLLTVLIGQEQKILLLDEPALNLHPTKQVELRRIFEQHASQNQLILVTHSPLLISMKHAKDTLRFVREKDLTQVIHLGKELEYSKNLRKHLGGKISDEQWGQILFADGMVLVEGFRDRILVEELDRYLKNDGANLQDDNWLVVEAGGKDGFPALIDIGQKLKIDWVVLTDYDGIMECKSRIKNRTLRTPVPAIFAYLIENGIMRPSDVTYLQNLERNGQSYKADRFAKVKEIAKRYRIFALPTDLEGALGISKGGQRKTRGVLGAVESILTGKSEVPPVFKEFLLFIRDRKVERLKKLR